MIAKTNSYHIYPSVGTLHRNISTHDISESAIRDHRATITQVCVGAERI